MKIAQVFNNNVVLVCHHGQEMVVLGTGIGFKRKPGDEIDESKIKKQFILQKNQQFNEIASVFNLLTQEEIDIIFEIVSDAKKKMHLKISDSIYPSLADHIHYVIERAKSNLSLKCPLDNEVRYIYPQEYTICLQYVKWLNERFQIDLQDSEASSIVLHLLNAERDEQIFERTVLETKIIKDIIDIVRMNYGIEFEEKNFSYRRFILHLQYFAKRVVKKETMTCDDLTLVELVKSNYSKAYQCSEKISKYIMSSQNYHMSQDELVYLTIHIQKITQDHI